MLVLLSLYVMLSILLSILVCAAASLFCACLVSVQVSAPYVIAGSTQELYTCLFRQMARLLLKISRCLAYAAQPAMILRCPLFYFIDCNYCKSNSSELLINLFYSYSYNYTWSKLMQSRYLSSRLAHDSVTVRRSAQQPCTGNNDKSTFLASTCIQFRHHISAIGPIFQLRLLTCTIHPTHTSINYQLLLYHD